MSKRVANKKYTPEFKKLVVETMLKGKLWYSETAERFEIRHKRVGTNLSGRRSGRLGN